MITIEEAEAHFRKTCADAKAHPLGPHTALFRCIRDSAALQLLQVLLSRREWDADLWDAVASVLKEAERPVEDLVTEHEDDCLPEIWIATPHPDGAANHWEPWRLWISAIDLRDTGAKAHTQAHHLRQSWPGHLVAVRPEGSPPKPLLP